MHLTGDVGGAMGEPPSRQVGVCERSSSTWRFRRVCDRRSRRVSSALPAALFTGAEENEIKSGDKVLLTGFGSGLNSLFTGIVW